LSLLVDVRLTKQKEIAPGYHRLTMAAPAVTEAARPGQFLHVRCGNTLDPLLRRPVSIHTVDRARGEVTLLYRAAGRGTALLAGKKKGEAISILGPLGRGFTLPGNNGKVAVVAGGIGIAPLYFLLQVLGERNIHAAVFWGAATEEQLFSAWKREKTGGKTIRTRHFPIIQEMEELGHQVVIATDDGTAGFPGMVTELFELCLRDPSGGNIPVDSSGDAAPVPEGFGTDRWPPGLVYGCGPRGMLKNLCGIIGRLGIPGEVSLEERMGCGVGACLSCACKTGDGRGGFAYRRACVDGPVFPAGEVIWE